MKRTIITIMAILTVIVFSQANAQIKTRKIAPRKETTTAPYDGTRNFLGKDVYQYIGQELYLNEKSEKLKKIGYEGFVKNYSKRIRAKSNVYKCCDGRNSKYKKLAGRYFKVLDVIKHPKAKKNEFLYGTKYFLKLEAKDNRDIVYYQYDAKFKHNFPFIVVAYFEKQKKELIGKEYVIRGENWWSSKEPMVDINTGKPVDLTVGSVWKCVDISIVGKYYILSLILKNKR